ncbi:MAG: sulfite exporter TauE/SafE family protein [Eubacteriales bacterium]|nr:sulfite exporter TauE/SafE family protein [Eubacteriales bacterium]
MFLYVGILAAAAFVQCLTGFGFGIFAAALLPLIMPFKNAVAILAILSVAVNFQLGIRVVRRVQWKVLFPVVLCSFVAQTVGAKLLFSADEEVLSTVLGLVLIGLAVFFAFLKERISIQASVRNGILAGLCGGILNTFNVGGPPIVIYYLKACGDKEEYLATVQATFFITSVYNCFLHILWGNVTAEILWYAAVGLLVVIPVIFLGFRVFQKISRSQLNVLVYGMIAAMGVIQIVAK